MSYRMGSGGKSTSLQAKHQQGFQGERGKRATCPDRHVAPRGRRVVAGRTLACASPADQRASTFLHRASGARLSTEKAPGLAGLRTAGRICSMPKDEPISGCAGNNTVKE